MVVLNVHHLEHLILQLFFCIKGQKDQSTKSYKRHDICIIFHLRYMVISKQFKKNNLRTSLFDNFARFRGKICRVATENMRAQLEGIK